MHFSIERARKIAGISGMPNNYPKDPKQRGAGFWAAIIGALGMILQEKDDTYVKLREDKDAEIARIQRELSDAQRAGSEEQKAFRIRLDSVEDKLRMAERRCTDKGLAIIAYQEDWSPSRSQEAAEIVAK